MIRDDAASGPMVDEPAGQGVVHPWPAAVGDDADASAAAGSSAICAVPEARAARSADQDYARAVGCRLRAVRSQQRLSLQGVQSKSAGKWKAVVVGSYERGDRAVSVARLADLAEFYGVPIGELLPADHEPADTCADTRGRLVLDLRKLQYVTATDAAPLRRYAQSIQRQRGDYGYQVLSIRREDLRVLALMLHASVDQLTNKLLGWAVLAPGSFGGAESNSARTAAAADHTSTAAAAT